MILGGIAGCQCAICVEFSFSRQIVKIYLRDPHYLVHYQRYLSSLSNTGKQITFFSVCSCIQCCGTVPSYILRFRFRLLTSYGYGFGSVLAPFPAPVLAPFPAPYLNHKKQFSKKGGFWVFLCTLFNNDSSTAPQFPLWQRMLGSNPGLLRLRRWQPDAPTTRRDLNHLKYLCTISKSPHFF